MRRKPRVNWRIILNSNSRCLQWRTRRVSSKKRGDFVATEFNTCVMLATLQQPNVPSLLSSGRLRLICERSKHNFGFAGEDPSTGLGATYQCTWWKRKYNRIVVYGIVKRGIIYSWLDYRRDDPDEINRSASKSSNRGSTRKIQRVKTRRKKTRREKTRRKKDSTVTYIGSPACYLTRLTIYLHLVYRLVDDETPFFASSECCPTRDFLNSWRYQ